MKALLDLAAQWESEALDEYGPSRGPVKRKCAKQLRDVIELIMLPPTNPHDQFIEELAKECDCPDPPCESLLAGGNCDQKEACDNELCPYP